MTPPCRNSVNILLNNFAVRKLLLRYVPGAAVGTLIAKLRRNHGAVAELEIDIAGGKIIALIGPADEGYPFQRHYFQASPLRISGSE